MANWQKSILFISVPFSAASWHVLCVSPLRGVSLRWISFYEPVRKTQLDGFGTGHPPFFFRNSGVDFFL